jgi:hypothetical protein
MELLCYIIGLHLRKKEIYEWLNEWMNDLNDLLI